ncbi:MAG: SUMF1/EgtB/PvdO family nonheme iron enzyme [Myxococcota bacterium]|nr:SUMF1/EgtB/PvdO family nonheme iron enzyme [Myxococcota bacterium]
MIFFGLACTALENSDVRTAAVEIKAGTYSVGPYVLGTRSQRSNREITLSYSYLIQATELSKGDYIRTTGGLPEERCVRSPDPSPLSLQDPISCISWCDAILLANVRSREENLAPAYQIPSGMSFSMSEIDCNENAQFVTLDLYASGWRLPTEAEWDIAALGWKKEAQDLEKVAWFDQNAENIPHAVRSKAANPQGVYDMQGNVSEWIWEEYGPLIQKRVKDPHRKEFHLLNGYARLIKGGNFTSSAKGLSLSARPQASAGMRSDKIGVRLVRTIRTVEE